MKKMVCVNKVIVFFSLVIALMNTPFFAEELPPGPLAILVVTKAADTNDGVCDGDCSLREAIAAASPNDTITFDASLSGATIPLSSQLVLSKNVTIDGSALPLQVSISGQNAVGVFYIDAGVTAALNGLTITRGKSTSGAGIYSNQGTVTVTDCTLSWNTVTISGGGIFNFSGTLTVANSTLWENDAYDYNGGNYRGSGGAIYNFGTMTMANSTLWQNFAISGGGICNEGLLTIVNSTLSKNDSYYSGAGILNLVPGTLNYSNTIIGNGICCIECFNSGTLGTNINNLVEDGTCAAAFSGDPAVGGLRDNGGPTMTCALLEGSRAIDSGSDPVCAAAPAGGADQRGVARPQVWHCDIGAYEYCPKDITAFAFASPPAVGTFNGTNIYVVVPFGTDVTTLVPTITHTGISVNPGNGVAQDFTNNVIYTVTGVDGSTKLYAVIVTVACGAPAIVTNANDSGLGSLRHAIDGVCAGGTITFSGDFTIPLASELIIGKNMTIDGAGNFVTISGNNAVRVFSVNTGVTAALSNLTIENGNAGGGNGGGILNPSGAALTVTNSTFTGCFSYLGGGIYNEGALTVANSTFSGNTTTDGGGICSNAPGTLNVTNSTFSGNRATWEGGSIFNTGAFTYANCILANSTVDSGGVECWTNVVPVSANNLIEDGSCVAAIIADPNLGPLANNGGYTQTMALLPGSPAIDAGSDAVCGASPVGGKDQRGITRPQGAHCDIGAYELTAQTGPVYVVNDNSDTDDGVCDYAPAGDCTLREALNAATAHPGSDTISFAPALSGQTIILGSTLTIDSDVTIDGSGQPITLSGNNAVRVFSVNTGVTAALSDLTVANGNAGGGNGGGILNPSGAALTVTNSTFTGCFSYLGGGIYNEGALTVANSTFSGNTTTDGGGICSNAPGTLNVANSTFSGNRAYWEGGSIFNTGAFTYSNCILANSTVDSGGVECWTNVVPVSTNNLIEDGSCYAAIMADPLLGPLGNYGGPTQTFPLLPGSVAINSGSSSYPALDQRGRSRVGACDIGAFESQGFVLSKSGGDNQTTFVNTAFSNQLSVSVLANGAGEPVDGGKITFTPPGGGASALISSNPVVIAAGTASVTATANGKIGSYNVTAGGNGINPGVLFGLTNLTFQPPPVGDGTLSTSMAAFSRNASIPDQIDVTYDAAHCLAEKAVILYGNLGNFSDYQGCADNDAGNDGTASFDSSGLNNVWFNIIWTNGTTGGHPGYGFDGVGQMARTWTMGTLCGMTGDNHGQATCP
jgi:fibronectin-binding autotransporter adhesin